jgi:serine/threonine-protein kinase
VPKGAVISSDPESGTKVAKDTEVNLVISDGPGKTTVPSEVGKQLADAKADLRANGFKVRVTYVAPQNGEAPGTVVDQNPGDGDTANRGSTVTLMVAKQETQQPPPDNPTSNPSSDPTKGGGWPPHF